MTTATPTQVPVTVVRRLVDLACRAPSVHNTQPWAWRLQDGRLELYADWTRRLEYADPAGRELLISCGAALHHLQVAARALGWEPEVVRLADGDDPTLLAVTTLSPASPSPRSTVDLQAIHDRCTDRRRFTAWRVPGRRLEQLAAAARELGTGASAVTDATDRFRVEILVSRAHHLQVRDAAISAEAERWTDHGVFDGVPASHVPWQLRHPESDRSRFGIGTMEIDDTDVESGDGIIVVHDTADSPAAWLRAGEGLSALWLRATNEGLSVVPLSQVVEAQETRDSFSHDILGGLTVPLCVVRVGWQPISRAHLTPTPRRSVDEVLRP
jgi:hypothetical protein